MPTVFYLTPLGMMPRQLRSDTIAGAVIWALSVMGKDVDPLIKDQSFRVSSAFPYVVSDGGKKIKLAPKPLIPLKSGDTYRENRSKKAIKKLNFLEIGIFNDLVSGAITASEIVNNIGSTYKIKGNLLLMTETEARFSSVSRERNTVSRQTYKAEEFFLSYGTVFENSGLYFVVQGSERWIDATKAAIRFLEDRGLGGEISIGQGHFKANWSEEAWPFNEPRDSDSIVNLSLYAPTSAEWNAMCSKKNQLYYSLVRRAGRNSDGTLKKGVYYLGEGSVIPLLEADGRHEYVSEQPKAVAWGHPLYVHAAFATVSKSKEDAL